MKTSTKRSMLAASLVLVGASATGCGAGGAPTDASEKEFCAHYNSLGEDLTVESSQKETVAIFKKWAKEAEEIGTPKSMSDSGREGFEIIIKQVDEVADDPWQLARDPGAVGQRRRSHLEAGQRPRAAGVAMA